MAERERETGKGEASQDTHARTPAIEWRRNKKERRREKERAPDTKKKEKQAKGGEKEREEEISFMLQGQSSESDEMEPSRRPDLRWTREP